jgi:TonB-linked SusC/RagA family outer membrane protein
MKIKCGSKSFAFSGFLCLFISLVLFSTSAFSQQGTQTVKLKKKELTLVKILDEIKEQTQFSFLYSIEDVEKYEDVKLQKLTYSVKSLLTEALKLTNLTYEIDDKVIVINVSENKQSVDKSVVVKNKTITGTVIDTDKYGLPGVSIIIEGTSKGEITDIDGNYSISVPDKPGVKLKYSFIGLESQVIPVSGKSKIDVVLKESSQKIEEVVVTGYQKIDRKLFTGTAQTLKAEEVVSKSPVNVASALQGKVAGVQISNVSSSFGSAPVITIRGNASINGSNKPLWVIDGVELEDLVNVSNDDLTSGNINTLLSSGIAGLNKEDIETFQILKDVSATALYGAKAMNGVIVITTKQGKKGKLKINYSGSLSFKEKPSYSDFDIMTSGEELSVYRQLADYGIIDMPTTSYVETYGALGAMYTAIRNNEITWGPNGTLNEDFLEQYGRANTDWFDLLFTNGFTQQHAYSMSGGTEYGSFYASVSYYKDHGYTIADKVDRYTMSLKYNFKPIENFKVGFKLSSNIRDQKVPGTKDRVFDALDGKYRRDFDISPFSFALNTSRSMRAYDNNGDLEYFRRAFAPFNIVHELNNNFVDINVVDVTGQADLEYKFKKDLVVASTMQMRRATTKNVHTIHESTNQAEAYRADYDQAVIEQNKLLFKDPEFPNSNAYSILPEGGFLNTRNNRLEHYYLRNTLNWSPRFGTDHSSNILFGTELNYTNRYFDRDDTWGISFDKGNVIAPHKNLQKYLNAIGQRRKSVSSLKDRRVSAFSTFGYTYLGRYIVNASFRVDGSNQLGSSPEARYLPSWNTSGAWNMHSEDFIKNLKIFDQLKLKATYGLNGSMGPNTSAELAIYTSTTNRPSDNETNNYIAALENEDLTWEKMYELNLGVEFSILKGLLTGEVTHYRRESIDLIDAITTSGNGGFRMKYGNVGNMDANGWEISLNTRNIKTEDFSWKTNFNINFHKSEITKLENTASIADAVSNLGAPLKGYPQRGLFSVKFAGLDDRGVPMFYGRDGKTTYKMSMQDRTNIDEVLHYEGALEPKMYGGLINTFKYKDLSLSVNIVYRWGNVIRLDDAFNKSYTDFDSFSKELNNRWMLPGDEKKTNIPAILDKRGTRDYAGTNSYALYNKSTERVAKGDFIRLKDISLSYRLPQSITKIAKLSNASISAQVTNVALLYSDEKLRGIDPEFYSSGGVATPSARMYTFNLSIGF